MSPAIIALIVVGYVLAGVATAAICYRVVPDWFDPDGGFALWFLMFWPCVPVFALIFWVEATIDKIALPRRSASSDPPDSTEEGQQQ